MKYFILLLKMECQGFIFIKIVSLILRLAFALVIMLLSTFFILATANDAVRDSDQEEFDLDVLKAMGVSESRTKKITQKNILPEGNNSVTVSVNAEPIDVITMSIDSNGIPCFDDDFLKKARIASKSSYHNNCSAFLSDYPDIKYVSDPNNLSLDIIVPEYLVTSILGYAHGGNAIIVNYNVSDSNYSYNSIGSTSRVAYLAYGFNSHNYIFRSYGQYIQTDDSRSYQTSQTYLTKTLEDSRSNLDAGEIYLKNSLFSLGQFRGLQIYPESRLYSNTSRNAYIMADSDGTLEIWQNGKFIRSTSIAMGSVEVDLSFLSDINSPVTLKIISITGKIEQKTIDPQQIFFSVNNDYNYAIGQLTDSADYFSTATIARNLNKSTSISAGMVTLPADINKFSLLAGGINHKIDDNINTFSVLRLSQAAGSPGISLNYGLSLTAHNASFQWSTAFNSHHYQNYPTNSNIDNGQKNNSNWSTNFNSMFNLSEAGSISTNIAYYKDNKNYNWSYRVNYNTNINNNAISLYFSDSHISRGKEIGLTLSVPLGGDYTRYAVQHNSNGLSHNLYYSSSHKQHYDYSLSASHDNTGNGFGVQIGRNTTLTSLRGNYSQSNHYQQRNFSASGGLVMHAKGVTLTNQQVGDTFTIVSVNDVLADSSINVNAIVRNVDYFGNAVSPNVEPFIKNSVDIDPATLAANIDGINSSYSYIPWRGSVSTVDFNAKQVKRIILNMNKNDPSYTMAIISDQEGNEMGVLQNNGQAFLSVPELKTLYLTKQNGQKCQLALSNLNHKENSIISYQAHCQTTVQ